MKKSSYDLVVVGAGIAGLVAARDAARAGVSTLLIESLSFGGLVTNVNEMDGDVTGSGAELASDLMVEASDLGAQVQSENVTGIERNGEGFLVVTDQGRHEARAVLAASGAVPRSLGVPGESAFTGRGVSHCADCDGPFFRGKDVVVVGGGDAALQSALLLAQTSRTVYLVHRRNRYRARPEYVERVEEHAGIQRIHDAQVVAIVGAAAVEAVEIIRGGVAGRVDCAGVFPFIGLQPASAYLPPEVQRNEAGHVLVDESMATSVPGLFAAGAVCAGYAGKVSDAMADGARAATTVQELLRERERPGVGAVA